MSLKRFDAEDFVVSIDSVSQTLFSQNLNPLTEFFTSSAQENDKSGEYYLAVFNTSSTESSYEVQSDIAFG